MKTKLATALGLLLLIVAIAYSPDQTESAESGQTVGADLVFTAVDLPEGTFENLVPAESGLVLSPTAVTGRYLSPVLDAPIPFNALVPQWLVEVPESGSFSIQVRTATAENQWDDWVQIDQNDDWILPEDKDLVGSMITISAADQTHQKFQFALSFSRYGPDPSPVLHSLTFSFINASQGPTAAELADLQAEIDEENPAPTSSSYPKPPVISREIWCTDPACDYTDGLSYYPVSHLLLHHTVSSNSSSDWAAVVRAIWYFHTFTRGWGDIGYNYLADMNGIIYEGHLGGDDVVGTHAAAANTGSMALSLIGTFTNPDDNPPGISPPPAMKEAAAALFSWKADQKHIDVYSAGMLPNMSWGLPTLAGHRDVYGTTQCPGDQAHVLLPWLRDEVASRIGLLPIDQYTDELSPAFTKSAGVWNVPPGNCGNTGHAYYAWSVTDPADGFFWGEWRPDVPFDALYEIQVYAPYCITGAPETDGAKYDITVDNSTSSVTVSHNDNVGNWMNLGPYDLTTTTNLIVRLTNLTTTDSDRGVWFDAIRLRPINVEGFVTPTNPAPDSWQQKDITFTWTFDGGFQIITSALQVGTTADFGNIIVNEPVDPNSGSFSYTIDQNSGELYWRIVGLTTQGFVVPSDVTHFSIDSVPPSSLITNIYKFADGSYRLFWNGSDLNSGVAGYDIQYRAESSPTWTNWLTGTIQTSTEFDPPDSQTYWFRSQATDNASLVEPPHPDPGDVNTDQALSISHAIMLPIILKQ